MQTITVKELENEGYMGIDVSLDISLSEYKLAWKEEQNVYTFFHICSDSTWIFDTIGKNIDRHKYWDWVDWNCFYSITGHRNKHCIELPQLVQDLLLLYGPENVFGGSSNGFTLVD